MLNVCYTVVGQPIADFVRERIEERNIGLADRNDLNIAISPEIMSVIKQSTAVSTTPGRSAHLLKVGSKRRRTRAEIEEHMEEQEEIKRGESKKDAMIEKLKRQLSDSKQKAAAAQHSQQAIDEMLASGFIVQREDGSYTDHPQ